jgi:hypothetical protein
VLGFERSNSFLQLQIDVKFFNILYDKMKHSELIESLLNLVSYTHIPETDPKRIEELQRQIREYINTFSANHKSFEQSTQNPIFLPSKFIKLFKEYYHPIENPPTYLRELLNKILQKQLDVNDLQEILNLCIQEHEITIKK